jgi:hypothetical protein
LESCELPALLFWTILLNDSHHVSITSDFIIDAFFSIKHEVEVVICTGSNYLGHDTVVTFRRLAL